VSVDIACLAIKTDGTLWSWGSGINQGRSTSIFDATSSPVQVGALTDWSDVSTGNMTIAIKTDKTLWTWGNNDNGQLGLGDTNNRSSPVQVGALSSWQKIGSGSSQSAAISG
jgi:alpha-tubulin suppressor-like RCC1 family protein